MKALIAMSGGVDSSVAALLMQKNGFDCIGCTMKLYDNADAGISRSRTCCTMSDIMDAERAANRIGIPYVVCNFMDGFREKVIDRFVSCYLEGRTPNPCIDCNRYMKFDELFERAAELGCEYVATGHYARVEGIAEDIKSGSADQEQNSTRFVLKKGLDPSKDQSYVLYTLTQDQLSHLRLPLGDLPKSRTREIAAEYGLGNADKPDSQDICFVPDGDYARVIELHTGKKAEPGAYIDKEGKVLGTHQGIIHYTIGQHRGLGLGGGGTKYVVELRPEDNTVVLGDREDLYTDTVYVGDFNWIAGRPPESAKEDGSFRCRAKLRYRQQEEWTEVTPVFPTNNVAKQKLRVGSDKYPDTVVKLRFDMPQRAVAPGQAAVLYDGDIVLGGGTILGSE